MNTAVQLLETYRGRDKVIRTCGYTIQLIAGLLPKEHQAFSDVLVSTASTLSGSRVVLRLCDDIPMLAYNLGYGLGAHEKDHFIRWVDVTKNMVDQIYGPIEHVMWATERQLLPGTYTARLKEWCTKIWAISLTLNILRSLRALIILRLKKQRLAREQQTEKDDITDVKESMKALRLQEFNVVLTLVGSASDLVNAINWMPPGFLWAGKNSLAFTGVMGMISSSIGLYRVYAAKIKQA
ncbi:peroxisomal membrane protein 11C-like isoform X1 [Branchiostoma lanceolatum]|uniref:PEX11G protein n=1 Tax=Branchiostoma lanceolatum TaxID=7740 RepID=A0A8J9ZC47_BRALA|nr:PEX11G [Branchiostoma lanceolatum]